MTKHIGFIARGITPTVPAQMKTDTFEVKSSAQECARLLDAAGWTNVGCFEVRSRVQMHDYDDSEELIPIEFRVHMVGAAAA